MSTCLFLHHSPVHQHSPSLLLTTLPTRRHNRSSIRCPSVCAVALTLTATPTRCRLPSISIPSTCHAVCVCVCVCVVACLRTAPLRHVVSLSRLYAGDSLDLLDCTSQSTGARVTSYLLHNRSRLRLGAGSRALRCAGWSS